MAVLAIDQGGTKTVALVSDNDGNILGCGTSFGACHFHVGLDRAMEAVRSASDKALAKANLQYGDIVTIMSGLAGANWPDEIEMLENGLRTVFGVKSATVYNDVVIAMRGGTNNPNAFAICGGTGLNCAVRTQDGVLKVYNNYVEDLDQGGGSLGMRTLLAIFQSQIGILPKTVLTGRVLDFFGIDCVDTLLLSYQRKQLQKPLKDVAFLLDDAAQEGDPVALGVLYDFGKSLSRYVIAAANEYNLAGKHLDVVLSGGAFKARNKLVIDTIRAQVHRVVPDAVVINAPYEPVVGALVMGLEQIHTGSYDKVRANCYRSAEKHGLMRNTDDNRSGFFRTQEYGN